MNRARLVVADRADERDLDPEARERHCRCRRRAAARDCDVGGEHELVGGRVARHGEDRVARGEADADDAAHATFTVRIWTKPRGYAAARSRVSPVSGEKK